MQRNCWEFKTIESKETLKSSYLKSNDSTLLKIAKLKKIRIPVYRKISYTKLHAHFLNCATARCSAYELVTFVRTKDFCDGFVGFMLSRMSKTLSSVTCFYNCLESWKILNFCSSAFNRIMKRFYSTFKIILYLVTRAAVIVKKKTRRVL